MADAKPSLPLLDRMIYIGLALVLVAVIAVLSFNLRLVAAEAQDLQNELELQGLLTFLRVPDEVLFSDETSMQQLAEVRRSFFARQGVESFSPYGLVLHQKLVTKTCVDLGLPVDDQDAMRTGSLEASWLTEAFRTCNTLAMEMELGEGLGGFLRKNPALFEQRVRPEVRRLLKAAQPWPRLGASMVLLAGGENSDEVASVLRALAAETKFHERDREHVQAVMKRYGIQ